MRVLILGLRHWRRSPLVAAAAILSIGLGVGATTAIFAVVRHVLLRPLPFASPDGLVMAWETAPDNPARWVAPANFLDWRRDTGHVFSGLAAFDAFSAPLTGPGTPERVRGVSASGTFFTLLGEAPAEGRLLVPDDDRAGAPCVAVASAGLRQRLFGTTPAIGAPLVLDGQPCTIVGVLPAAFVFPLQASAELWTNGDRGVPRTSPGRGDPTTVRDAHTAYVLGRLRPGVDAAAAERELNAVMRRLAVAYPDTNTGLGAHVESLHAAVVGDITPVLVLLQVTVVVLLLVAAANVVHLLLGQAARRRQEFAVRASLGGTRSALVRDLLGEAAALALPGALGGVLLAAWGIDVLVAAAPPALPRLGEVTLDPAVLVFGVAITSVATLACALIPALRASAPAAAPSLAHGVRLAGRQHTASHRAFVVAELALAHLLVVSALLLAASLVAATRLDPGFAVAGRLTAQLTLIADPFLVPRDNGAGIATQPRQQLVDVVSERMQAEPGVMAVAASFTPPLGGAPNRGVLVAGEPEPPPGQEPAADFQAVTPDYFRAAGIALLEGRTFTAADRAATAPVAIVNRTFADRYLHGRAAGSVVTFGGTRHHQVVGVVADTRNRQLERAPEPAFYVPLAQNDEAWPYLTFIVWSTGDPAQVAPALRAAIAAAAPTQPVSTVRTVSDLLAAQLAPRRFTTWLVGLFGAVALVLAVIGAYGVLSLSVAARQREIGVRSALGASPRALRLLILREAAGLTVAAVALGGAVAAASGRLGQALLFEVSATSPMLLLLAGAVVVVPALLAAWVPAERAARTAPGEALRGH